MRAFLRQGICGILLLPAVALGTCAAIATAGRPATQVNNDGASIFSQQANELSREAEDGAAKIKTEQGHYAPDRDKPETIEEYLGVGMFLRKEGHEARVVATLPGSPARSAGIVPGDLVTTIDGRKVDHLTKEKISRILKADTKGSIVSLTIIRFSSTHSPQKLTVSLKRGSIEIRTKQLSLGQDASDFELRTVNGDMVSLAQFQGRPVLLYFFTTWCVFCRAIGPTVVDLDRQYRQRGLVTLGIDEGEKEKTVVDYLRQTPAVTYSVLLDSEEQVNHLYGNTDFPQFVLVDQKGKIAAFGIPRERKDIESGIQKIISNGEK